jgi:hypothetical protein
MKNSFLFLFAFALILSCEKADKLEDNEYFIFGVYNGYCSENCSTLFKIEDEKLFADDVDAYYPGQELKFKDVPLSSSKYDFAIDAFENIPERLLNGSEMSFGCPGCVDQDIILLVYFDGSDEEIWTVDTDIDVLPDYLMSYAEEILTLVGELEK